MLKNKAQLIHAQIRKTRNQSGFTLAFALILTIIFSSLLLGIFVFVNSNSKQSLRSINKLQSIALAEAGNGRAIARMNVKTLPDIDGEDVYDDDDFEDDDFDEDDDDFFDDEDDDDFFDDDDDDDDDFFDDEDDDDDEFFEDEFNLKKIPRYINFFIKDPYYVNVNSGEVVSQNRYFNLISEQRESIALARKENPDDPDLANQLLIEDLYLPLPEVNVQRVGAIPFPRGIHFKPGLKVIIANKVPVELKQNSIREEYLNVFPEEGLGGVKTKLYSVSPNYGEFGQIIDINASGENLDSASPRFSDPKAINIINSDQDYLTAEITADAKAGKYRLKWGSDYTFFYVTPTFEGGDEPEVDNLFRERSQEEGGGKEQFSSIKNGESQRITIIGNHLGSPENPPIVVPDAKGIEIDIESISETNLVFTMKARKAIPGNGVLSVFTKGGQSNSWIFNIEEATADDAIAPTLGTYTTVITLLEANSLSNIPFGEPIESTVDPSGRADAPDTGSGRAEDTRGADEAGNKRIRRNFNLLQSDLETIWKVETVATVNKISHKATTIVRRSLPIVNAALTTNSRLSFGQTDIEIKGVEQAATSLQDSASTGDITIEVEGEDADGLRGITAIDDDRESLECGAVIEDLNCQEQELGPGSRGFEIGKLVAIIDPNASDQVTDYSIIESLGSNTITVEDPGFNNSHFINDKVVQFIPSVVTDFPIGRLAAEKHLKPGSTHIKLEGSDSFQNVFQSRLDDIKNWTGTFTEDTEVPLDDFEDFEGYYGLNIISGTPNFDGLNALAGEGLLIIDTTQGGISPAGTVRLGGNSKLPSLFDGIIYIIGKLKITGAVEISGGVVVNSPEQSTIDIGGRGFISYNEQAISKALLGVPFTKQLHGLKIETSENQENFLKANSGAIEQKVEIEQKEREEKIRSGDDQN